MSAYHRLRHQERHRRRFRTMHLLKTTESNQQNTEEVFDNLRRHLKRERNEALCESHRNTVHMNTPFLEYDPPFMVEIRCRNIAEFERNNGLSILTPQTCVYDLLRCVQVYKDVHFSRRKVGSNKWYPYVLSNVPSSCDCMWPVDKYGHQEL
ncbi:unnamed protein product [Dracunculus medinensis]|uniref:Spaetzle domain-containing protein n=1 Tax=Dracunculus medinensis TaxID=318479 RepID=A0A0N4UA79_DRAME|nr:unnamed protein product [Dracunculus medinensis]